MMDVGRSGQGMVGVFATEFRAARGYEWTVEINSPDYFDKEVIESASKSKGRAHIKKHYDRMVREWKKGGMVGKKPVYTFSAVDEGYRTSVPEGLVPGSKKLASTAMWAPNSSNYNYRHIRI